MKILLDESVYKDVVAALGHALTTADVNGIKKDKLKQVMRSVTGKWPEDKLFNQVMWTVGYNTGTNNLYYAQGKVPEQFKKAKKEKPAKGASIPTPKTGQSVTLEGDEMVVTVKGSGHDFKSKAVKVIVFISALAGFFWVANMFI